MKNKNQVELYKLLFAQNWEDPGSDILALDIKEGDSIITITSGGCNTLGFLVHDPKVIYSVDINPSQSHLMQLKIAAIKNLDYNECIGFFGLTDRNDRLDIYERIKNDLDNKALDFWDYNSDLINKGIIMNGRYEKFVKIVSKLIRFIQGNKRVNGLFNVRSFEEQKHYFNQNWNTWRTRLIFNLFFNKWILAKKGLDAKYFHFDDGSGSFAESFFKRFSQALTNIKTIDNYFLHLYLKGEYRNLEEVPDYLKEKNYKIIQKGLSRLKLITADAKKWLAEMPDNSINCFALSNICELMSEEDTRKLFKEVSRTAVHGARICFRNLMIPREVPDDLRNTIRLEEELSNKIKCTDRSFVYGKVTAYRVIK